MADFCKQCSIETFGEDCGDLEGISSPDDTENKRYARALCEGCGYTAVDHNGICVNASCLKKHGHPLERPAYDNARRLIKTGGDYTLAIGWAGAITIIFFIVLIIMAM